VLGLLTQHLSGVRRGIGHVIDLVAATRAAHHLPS
jgi:hypothetical protein